MASFKFGNGRMEQAYFAADGMLTPLECFPALLLKGALETVEGELDSWRSRLRLRELLAEVLLL